MFKKMNLVISLLICSSLFLGCQTTSISKKEVSSISENAIMCAKCKTTWVETENPDGDIEVHTYRSQEVTTCPDCTSAVDQFFKTGKLKHACNSCGDALEHCKFMKWEINKIRF